MSTLLRYKREEIKIQAWESQQKAKLEAEMRRIEVLEILSLPLSGSTECSLKLRVFGSKFLFRIINLTRVCCLQYRKNETVF